MPNRGTFNTSVWGAESSGTTLSLLLSETVGGVDGLVDTRNFDVIKALADAFTLGDTLGVIPTKMLLEAVFLTDVAVLDLQKGLRETVKVRAWLTIRRGRNHCKFTEVGL